MTSIPKWGRVVARPHEFLIQMRNGRVTRSGQGLSCFKWPWDSIAVIPTSIQKLQFRADQVTLEKTGVEVTGLAVYRVAEPLLAYRMLDVEALTSNALAAILCDMFIGATRRIVAGLTLEACITHRKERVASALMEEIAPVLRGEGAPEDGTSKGWGVVIDTIEIQDVKVLSEEVFSRLQAPYREALALEALLARDNVAREQARLEAEQRRRAEQARRELMAEEEARLEAERRREADARAHTDALALRAQEAERARASIELAARREAGELEAELVRLERAARVDLTEARLREVLMTETMPAMANAFRGSFDRINLTTGDGAKLFGFLSAGIDQVMDTVERRSAAR
jgi:flotillin